MTGADHQHSAAVDEAAAWLADQHQPPKPIVPALRQRFGLSSLQATEACAMAGRFRMLRRAFG